MSTRLTFTLPLYMGTVLTLAAITGAHAQTTQPGLWEHHNTLKTASGQWEGQMAQVQQQMAALPPDQRKMMEQMLGQQGLSMGGGGRTTVQYCVTPEEAAKATIPTHDEQCRYQITRRTAQSLSVAITCDDEGKSRGEGTVTFQGDKAYQGTFVMHTLIDGQRERMEMTQSGRWLSAQCGQVGQAAQRAR